MSESTSSPTTTQPLDLSSKVHRRFNPLSNEWVLVSPHRTARPWQGQVESPTNVVDHHYDPTCYLCPGNTRANGEVNPPYTQTYVFDNDFAALTPNHSYQDYQVGGLIQAQAESGQCRVICYSPDHSQSMSKLSLSQIMGIIQTWTEEYSRQQQNPHISAVTIFENRGAQMGASNPHPHGQIWANQTIPNELLTESNTQRNYWNAHHQCLLCAYASLEWELKERLVYANNHFMALVPFWAVWPFETMILPRHHHATLNTLTTDGQHALADVLKVLTSHYDALFQCPFPYTMGLHQMPTQGYTEQTWHCHMHFYPPLLRSATIKKFMVGYEMLAGPQRDITAEQAADQLRRAKP